MGTVYEAIDQRLNNQVALKEMISSGSYKALEAFEREAQLLANLDHPNLPKVFDHFSENDGNFLVMQFIKGLDLQEWLDSRSGPFAQTQVLEWADVVLGVLQYLHSHRPPILHRDIKPANIKRSEQGRIFLLDFGLAKGSAGQMATYSTERSVRGGTPPYESLEQLLGQRTEPCSDLYSLAATLYHLISNLTPVNAATRHQDMEDGQPDPLQFGNEFTPSVAAVIHRAMAISRKDRIASATELSRALQNAVEDDRRSLIEDDYRRAEERRREREEERLKQQRSENPGEIQNQHEVANTADLKSTLVLEGESSVRSEPLNDSLEELEQPPLAEPIFYNKAELEPEVEAHAESAAVSPGEVKSFDPAVEQIQNSLKENAVPIVSSESARRQRTRNLGIAALLILMGVFVVGYTVFFPTLVMKTGLGSSTQPTPAPTPAASPQLIASEPALADTKESLSFNSKVNPSEVATIDANVHADGKNNGWTNSGLIVTKGQNLLITASGEVTLGNNISSEPKGLPDGRGNEKDKLIPAEPMGGLVGVIGDDNDDFFFIGAAKHVIAKRGGVLFLGVNEESFTDNSGSFNVVIRVEKLKP